MTSRLRLLLAASAIDRVMSHRHRRVIRSSVRALCGVILAACCSGLVACGGSGGGARGDGTLTLTVFTEVAGTPYRLSSARFEVTASPAAGAAPVTLSTADSPTALALQEVLPPGEYNVALQAGWVLERQAAASFDVVSGATLTSGSTLMVSLVSSQIVRAGFVFEAAGTTVDFQPQASESESSYD
jgi:hypothetical protein